MTWSLAERFAAALGLSAADRVTRCARMAAFTYPVAFTPDERSVLTTAARMLAQALTQRAPRTTSGADRGAARLMAPMLGPETSAWPSPPATSPPAAASRSAVTGTT